MSQWYEVRHEVHGTSNGRTTLFSRHSVTRFESEARPGRQLHAPPRVQAGVSGQARTLPPRHPTERATAHTAAPSTAPPQRMPAGRPAETARMHPHGLVYERVSPASGWYVRVPFGRFRAELSPQMQAPQDVPPAHPVDCLLHVYRIYQPLPVSRLALTETGSAEDADRFSVLTHASARALGVPVRFGTAPVQAGPSAARVAQPGQHLWMLAPLFDPTYKTPFDPASAPETDPA